MAAATEAAAAAVVAATAAVVAARIEGAAAVTNSEEIILQFVEDPLARSWRTVGGSFVRSLACARPYVLIRSHSGPDAAPRRAVFEIERRYYFLRRFRNELGGPPF